MIFKQLFIVSARFLYKRCLWFSIVKRVLPILFFIGCCMSTPITNTYGNVSENLDVASNWNGPFGLTKGIPLATLQKYFQLSPFIVKQPDTYWIPNPPKKQPEFPMVGVTVTQKNGVCAVSGNRVENTESQNLAAALFKIVSGISKEYGAPNVQTAGRAMWQLSNNFAPLQSIIVATDKISDDIALISVTYRFDNYDQCKKEWAENSDIKEENKENAEKLTSSPI